MSSRAEDIISVCIDLANGWPLDVLRGIILAGYAELATTNREPVSGVHEDELLTRFEEILAKREKLEE